VDAVSAQTDETANIRYACDFRDFFRSRSKAGLAGTCFKIILIRPGFMRGYVVLSHTFRL
jgi:hypothetical protein